MLRKIAYDSGIILYAQIHLLFSKLCNSYSTVGSVVLRLETTTILLIQHDTPVL